LWLLIQLGKEKTQEAGDLNWISHRPLITMAPSEFLIADIYQQKTLSLVNTSATRLSYEIPPLVRSMTFDSLPDVCTSMIFFVLASGACFRICKIFIPWFSSD
jgi:hypothetical protein